MKELRKLTTKSTLVDFEVLKGQTVAEVIVDNEKSMIVFVCKDGKRYALMHRQECCEEVTLEDFDAKMIENLPGHEILEAYGSSEAGEETEEMKEWGRSSTWTFFVIRTMLDTYTIRFFGSSNGYYSEDAELYEIKGD